VKTYLALSALLSHPESVLVEALPEISAALDAEAMLPRAARRALDELIAEVAGADLYDLQERYVSLFDRSRALSLHLFEHVHGESRDRGQALVDLAERYRERGFRIVGNELSDYLPLFLEYLSLLPRDEAKDQLAETARILRTIGDGLARRGSRYAAALAALLAMAGEPGLTERIAPRPGTPEEESAEALDRTWGDEPVTFGGACPPEPAAQPVRFYRTRTPA
jgi:nitrate reductase molybdenum cofactor assembly chaperone NarJ/NarW